MTTRRMTTTLGVLALGIATVGIGPAVAQTGGAGPAGAPGTTGSPGAMTAPGTMPGYPAAPMGGSAGPGQAMPPAGMGQGAGMAEPGKTGEMTGGQQAGRGTNDEPVPSRSYAGAQARNPEVDRLNEQSLEAARRNEPFHPTSQR